MLTLINIFFKVIRFIVYFKPVPLTSILQLLVFILIFLLSLAGISIGWYAYEVIHTSSIDTNTQDTYIALYAAFFTSMFILDTFMIALKDVADRTTFKIQKQEEN